MKPTPRPAAAAGLVAALTSACGPTLSPRLRPLPLELRAIDLVGVELSLPFEVQNPHPQGHALVGLDGEISVAGRPWRTLGGDEGLTGVEGDGDLLRIPLTTTWEELYGVARATRGTDALPYLAAGAWALEGPEGALALPFEQSGGLPALRPPTFSPDSLSAQPVVGGGWLLEIGLLADNDMGTPWRLGAARVALEVDGLPVGEAEVDLASTLPGPGATGITLIFPVDAVADGPALQGSLGAESVVLRMTGEVEVDGAGVAGRAPLRADGEARVQRADADTGSPGVDTGGPP